MKRILTIILMCAICISLFPATLAQAQEIEVTRIQGSDRYITAVEVSKNTFKESRFALVAYGGNYPDALIGGTLAVQLKAPILLTEKDGIRPEAIEEMNRLGVKKIFVLGGEAAVSNKVFQELKKVTSDVERLSGRDRYDTSNRINEVRYKNRPDLRQDAIGDLSTYVSGTNFPDALAAAPLYGQTKAGDTILNYLRLARPGRDVAPFIAIGGSKVVRHSFDQGGPWNYQYRIAGRNRYETAVEIAKQYPKELDKTVDTVILTNGTNYPDALSSAPLVASRNACLLLTHPQDLPEATKSYIKNNKIQKVIVIGGENSVSAKVVQELVK